jgi:hypothetical protein
MEDIRIKDERDEKGSGFLTVEMNVNGAWVVIHHTWFWKGNPSEVWVHHDSVGEISLSQFTDERSMWTKQTRKSEPSLGRHFNFTVMQRMDAPLKKKGDC